MEVMWRKFALFDVCDHVRFILANILVLLLT
jgi:hypothetical protein